MAQRIASTVIIRYSSENGYLVQRTLPIYACTKLGIDDPTAVDHWPDAAQVMPRLKGRPDKVNESNRDFSPTELLPRA